VTLVDFEVSDSDHVWLDRLYERAEESYRQHAIELARRQQPQVAQPDEGALDETDKGLAQDDPARKR
jgi:hypothetical protein